MPIHDWTRVDAGIFHDFLHEWISTIRRALNDGLLPPEYYALAEQQAAGFGPDVLTLQAAADAMAESAGEFYRRKKSTVVIRHVSGDRIIAVVEVISPGNKAARNPFKALIDKACELLEHKIHLLVLDLFPPTRRDPNGIHGALWEEITGEPFGLPAERQLTLAAYESALTIKAYVEPVAWRTACRTCRFSSSRGRTSWCR